MVDELPVIRGATFEDLTTRQFHDIMRLRESVFVVEQRCVYAELDGRDVLPDTVHMWIEHDNEVVAYLRLYPGPENAEWIGRVVTAARHRGRGLARALVSAALTRARRPVRISAQSRLAGWYQQFGFERCGADFEEAGIEHTPMVLS